MDTKTFLIITALCSGAYINGLFAQTTASGSAGAASTGTGTTSATGTTTGSAGGSNVGALPAPGTPNMSSTMPSRSVLEATDANLRGAAAAEANALPTGIGAAPSQPGVSPLSGLPISELPAVSRGTAPIGPHAAATSTTPQTPATSGEVTARRRAMPTQPIEGAAHPQANPQIGMGVTGPGMTMVVPTPPPSAQVEVATPAPSGEANHVWVPGHYSWVGGQWTWISGGWQRPPTPGAVWVPGAYDAQNHRWTEGRWETTGAASRERDRQQQRDRSGTEPRR